MKKLFIYTPYWSTWGGGEKYVLTLAAVLSKFEETFVTILSTCPDITKDELSKFVNLNINKIQLLSSSNYEDLAKQISSDSIFVCLSNFRVYRSSAKHNIQILQVPYGPISTSTMVKKLFSGKLKESIKDIYRKALLEYSRTAVDMVLTNSGFVHDVLQRHHRIQSDVLYPPIQDFMMATFHKKKYILSVGRFFRGLYNEKRYDILTEAFRHIYKTGIKDWEYHIIGTAFTDKKTQKYLYSLQKINEGYPVYFHVNADYNTLVQLYNEASIFWHAAGYGIDESKEPERVEHFGMTTVEAMSAGCIPVVINKGGQREIITDGVNGILWDNVDQLISRTMDVIQNKINTEIIRKEARQRALDFSFEKFSQRVVDLFSNIINI